MASNLDPELTSENENIAEECYQYFPLKRANPFLNLSLALWSKMVLEASSTSRRIETETP